MSDEGATPRELLFEACRRNNTSLLDNLLSTLSQNPQSTPNPPSNSTQSPSTHPPQSPQNPPPQSTQSISTLLNTARDPLGNFCLHVAARSGAYEILDILLDQEGLEVDPIDRLEGDTPLHSAVRFVNSLSREEWEAGGSVVEVLVDAGGDVRIRNKSRLKPIELVDPRNTELRSMLQKAEYAHMAGGDVVDRDDGGDEGGEGSASDSG